MISSSSRPGARPVSSSTACTSADQIAVTELDRRQVDRDAAAASATTPLRDRPRAASIRRSGMIMPLSSASGMNSAGGTTPRVGWSSGTALRCRRSRRRCAPAADSARSSSLSRDRSAQIRSAGRGARAAACPFPLRRSASRRGRRPCAVERGVGIAEQRRLRRRRRCG